MSENVKDLQLQLTELTSKVKALEESIASEAAVRKCDTPVQPPIVSFCSPCVTFCSPCITFCIPCIVNFCALPQDYSFGVTSIMQGDSRKIPSP